jgi:hypothetical protein
LEALHFPYKRGPHHFFFPSYFSLHPLSSHKPDRGRSPSSGGAHRRSRGRPPSSFSTPAS